MIDQILSINEYLDDDMNYKYLISKKLNPERALYEFFKKTKILKQIKFCKRVQFVVAKENESKRWASGYKFYLTSNYWK